MPRPTTSVRRSAGSRGAGLVPPRAGRADGDGAGAGGAAGLTDEKGGLDIGSASLIETGRNGGTPRPLSGDSAGASSAGEVGSGADWRAASEGGKAMPAGSLGSSPSVLKSFGFLRLNNACAPVERRSAYHSPSWRNNSMFRSMHYRIELCGAAFGVPAFDIAASSTCTMAATPITGIRRLTNGT